MRSVSTDYITLTNALRKPITVSATAGAPDVPARCTAHIADDRCADLANGTTWTIF